MRMRQFGCRVKCRSTSSVARGVGELIQTTVVRAVGWGRPPIEAASLLWLNVWRRMVMSDMPFTAALSNKHGEAARSGYRFALTHSGKLVKPGEYYSVL